MAKTTNEERDKTLSLLKEAYFHQKALREKAGYFSYTMTKEQRKAYQAAMNALSEYEQMWKSCIEQTQSRWDEE